MKKQLSKPLSLALALSMTLSMTACGGEKDTAPVQPNQGGSAAMIETEKPSKSEQQGISLSKYLSSGETIWYRVNGMEAAKDVVVGEILVFEADGTMYCAEDLGLTMGELTEMEDADIVATVKDTHRLKALGTLAKFPDMDVHRLKERLFQGLIYEIEMFALEYPDGIPDDVLAANMDSAEVVRLIKPFLDELCAVCRELYESGETYGVAGDNLGTYFIWGPKEDAEVMLEGYYGPVGIEKMKAMHDSCTAAVEAVCDYVENYEAEPGQYKFSINTDKTGNVAESLTLAYRIPVGDEYEIDSFTLRGASGEGEVVYDAMYGGFVLTRGSQLLTRVDGSYNFVVEQIGESDLPIDVEPEELFQ